MSKLVAIDIIIDEDGNYIAEAVGTEGDECLTLLKLLDGIDGMSLVEEGRTGNFYENKVRTVNAQKVQTE
jgi:hypothetical protein